MGGLLSEDVKERSRGGIPSVVWEIHVASLSASASLKPVGTVAISYADAGAGAHHEPRIAILYMAHGAPRFSGLSTANSGSSASFPPCGPKEMCASRARPALLQTGGEPFSDRAPIRDFASSSQTGHRPHLAVTPDSVSVMGQSDSNPGAKGGDISL